MSDPKPPEPPRVDPAVIQQWRDRQLKNIPKEKLSKAEEITAANRLAELFNNPQVLHGKLTRTGASGGTVQVALDKPYKGLSSIPATAATGCDRFGKVTLLPDKDKNWYAFGGGVEKKRSARDKERSGDPSKSLLAGRIAYCYAVFVKRREGADKPYKWFWQVFVGGFLEKNILIKEWEIPEKQAKSTYSIYKNTYYYGNNNSSRFFEPEAIVDFRGDTFYVSLQYIVFDKLASEERYALIKGSSQEDLETEWDKSTIEMTDGSSAFLKLIPHGFGYWSSGVNFFVSSNSTLLAYTLWEGKLTPLTGSMSNSGDDYTSNSAITMPSPHGWKESPKQITSNLASTSSNTSTNDIRSLITFGPGWYGSPGTGFRYDPNSYYENFGANSTYQAQSTNSQTIKAPVLYRLSEDGTRYIAGCYVYDNTGSSETSEKKVAPLTVIVTPGLDWSPFYVGIGIGPTTYGYNANSRVTTSTIASSKLSIKMLLQGKTIYSYEQPSSYSRQATYPPLVETISLPDLPAVIKKSMAEKGGNLPFMAKMADKGDAFTSEPANPAIATGSFLEDFYSIAKGEGSPYLTDVHDEFISAIQRPDLLNRGTTETQNIYGDLSPIYPLVANPSALTALTGLQSGVYYGVVSVEKVFAFDISSETTANGITVINGYGGYGRWHQKGELPANPAKVDDKKLSGRLSLSDIFPELLDKPPKDDWIGYNNIEHENRTVKVYLWNHELTKLHEKEPIELEVEKIDAIALILENKTLQTLLSYTFFNASYGG